MLGLLRAASRTSLYREHAGHLAGRPVDDVWMGQPGLWFVSFGVSSAPAETVLVFAITDAFEVRRGCLAIRRSNQSVEAMCEPAVVPKAYERNSTSIEAAAGTTKA